MLYGTIVSIALASLIAFTFLSAGMAMSRATIHRISQRYLASGFQIAGASLEQRLSAQIAAGAPASPLPTFTPLPSVCADAITACRYRVGETIVLTQQSQPQTSASCDTALSNCAENEESNTFVNESRISARITVVVSSSDGMVLAQRTGDVLLRTLSVPPYVAVSGARDGTFDDFASARATGDDGGAPAATPNPCSSAVPGVALDTSVRVAYQDATSQVCTDGSSWRTQSYGTTSSAPAGWAP